MPEISVASLNTWGAAVRGSALAARYAAIGRAFEASAVDLVCFQEVVTYVHLRRLARFMPSFRHVVARRTPIGPAGGVVTLSRRPVAASGYHRFPWPPRYPGLPWRRRFTAPLKGTLVSRLATPDVAVLTTHPVANRDGDWSPANRHHPMHRDQLAALTRLVRATAGPVVLCGDFNVARDSTLFAGFRTGCGLVDAFGGDCPPTFHAEYLGPDHAPHCIDFILTTPDLRASGTRVLFAGRHPLPGGARYLSDHLGLQATLVVG